MRAMTWQELVVFVHVHVCLNCDPARLEGCTERHRYHRSGGSFAKTCLSPRATILQTMEHQCVSTLFAFSALFTPYIDASFAASTAGSTLCFIEHCTSEDRHTLSVMRGLPGSPLQQGALCARAGWPWRKLHMRCTGTCRSRCEIDALGDSVHQ